VIATALLFDFTNGFHDAANAVATSISTRAVPPNVALAAAAILNVLGAVVSTHVAATLAKGIVDPGVVTNPVILGGLLGAITWNLLTWWWALPSSSSHCLIGGIGGAVLATSGPDGVLWSGILHKVLIPTLLAPLVGFSVGIGLMVAILWLFRRANPGRLMRRFRLAQLASASVMAFSHGANDAQKTMGVITLALFAAGELPTLEVPFWVKLASALTIGIGTYTGGRRIIRTLGMRLVKLTPAHGFAAETAASGVLLAGAGRPQVAVRGSVLTVTGLPAGTGIVEVTLYQPGARIGRSRAVRLSATATADGGPPRQLATLLRRATGN